MVHFYIRSLIIAPISAQQLIVATLYCITDTLWGGRAASIPNITSFHVFLGLRGVGIVWVCSLLGNMKNLFHNHRLLVMPFQQIRATTFRLANNRCPHQPHRTGAGWSRSRRCQYSCIFIIVSSNQLNIKTRHNKMRFSKQVVELIRFYRRFFPSYSVEIQ